MNSNILDEILAKAKLLKDAREQEFPEVLARESARKIVQKELNVVDDYFFSHGQEQLSLVIKGMGWGFDYVHDSNANETAFLVAAVEHLCERVKLAEETLRQIASAASDEDFFMSQTEPSDGRDHEES